ncbi:hypothetical protein BDA99DRAFT_540315 [Phascolomyces articulosus]|uniref:Uncharacterized protein n=1 Tax=Phascolomyces articulosus TaxID=60185 RepID=A0AAD5K7L9_9FUNG|nr:hypothetical protein BDA99DRAFT_540315 [Phascolomyces articulosus]
MSISNPWMTKTKALTTGVTLKEERILALPHLQADANLIKVNLYQFPVCNPHTLKDELHLVLSNFNQVAQIRAYVSRKNHVFRGEATALLDVSLLGIIHPNSHATFIWSLPLLLGLSSVPRGCPPIASIAKRKVTTATNAKYSLINDNDAAKAVQVAKPKDTLTSLTSAVLTTTLLPKVQLLHQQSINHPALYSHQQLLHHTYNSESNQINQRISTCMIQSWEPQ